MNRSIRIGRRQADAAPTSEVRGRPAAKIGIGSVAVDRVAGLRPAIRERILPNNLREGLMPEKKKRLTQAEQVKRFREKARESIDAGELNRSDADNMIDRMVRKSIKDHGA
jgi:hypothetical protein